MTKKLVWWQAYKACLAGGHDNDVAVELANQAVIDYAKCLFGKEPA